MGLNIGIEVKRQDDRYMSYGSNPKGTIAEIEAAFKSFLHQKFPGETFNPSVTFREQEQVYDFDVYMHYRDATHLYLAILEFVLEHFSIDYGIDAHIYHAP